MPAPSNRLRIDINSVTDVNGAVHCWGCGEFLPNVKRRGGPPVFLCKDCYPDYHREVTRQNMAALRMRRAIQAGRLPGPPLRTTLEEVLRPERRRNTT